MEFYICVICTVKRPPLFSLKFEDRQIFEAILAPAVSPANLNKLKKTYLLTCPDCKQLIHTVQKFQDTALVGVKNLLGLLALVQKTPDSSDPLLLEIKKEPEDALLQPKSFIEIQREDEYSKARPQPEAAVKAEPGSPEDSSATVSCESDVEDSIPAAPTSRQIVQPARSAPAALPPGRGQRGPGSLGAGAAGMAPNRMLALASSRPEGTSVTPSQRPSGGAGHDSNETSLQTLLHRTVGMPRLLPKPSPGGSAPAAARGPPAGPPQPQRIAELPKLVPKPSPQPGHSAPAAARGPPAGPPQAQVPAPPPSSPWYVRVLKEAELQAELRAARGAAHFAHARLRCEPCALAFGSQDEAERHAALHLPSAGEYECQTCTQRLPTVGALQEHRAAHTVRYFCCYCSHSTADCAVIKRHTCDAKNLKWESSNFTKDLCYQSSVKRRAPVPFKCKLCYNGFTTEAGRDKHMIRYHKKPPEPQTCKVCGRLCRSEYSLRMHMYNHKYKDSWSEDPLRSGLYCVECQLPFTSPSAYRNHLRLSLKHSTKESWLFQCHDCGKKFQSKSIVRKHILMVHGTEKDRDFKCDKCSKSFVTPSALRRHGEAHAPGSRPRRHVCHLCGKAFTVKKSLVEHLLMHAGARPHACAQCGATFTFKAALYTHNRLKHLHIKRSWRKKPRKPKKGQKGKDEPKLAVESLEASIGIQTNNES